MKSQCEHEFAVYPETGEVQCIKCGGMDDEMQLPVKNLDALEAQEQDEEFHKNQMDFE
jgi:hypothetical protein